MHTHVLLLLLQLLKRIFHALSKIVAECGRKIRKACRS
jgi:hypothetical protein